MFWEIGDRLNQCFHMFGDFGLVGDMGGDCNDERMGRRRWFSFVFNRDGTGRWGEGSYILFFFLHFCGPCWWLFLIFFCFSLEWVVESGNLEVFVDVNPAGTPLNLRIFFRRGSAFYSCSSFDMLVFVKKDKLTAEERVYLASCKGSDSESIAQRVIFDKGNADVPQVKELVFPCCDVLG